MNWFIREVLGTEGKYDARNKARYDIDVISQRLGFSALEVSIPESNNHHFSQIINQFKLLSNWIKTIKRLKRGDSIVIQFMPVHFVICFHLLILTLKLKGVNSIALVHDLDWLRDSSKGILDFKKTLIHSTSKKALKHFMHIIVHNEIMKKYVNEKLKIEEDKVVALELFDYLLPNPTEHIQVNRNASIAIAGNLSTKAGYVYHLPNDVQFELYGKGYINECKDNINYNGAFLPEELPFQMKESFGLVWDGPSSTDCAGSFGNYLRFNNPHKTSLYLSAGIPVIIWDKAALAQFIESEDCGFTVSSIYDIGSKLRSITDEDYNNYCLGAAGIQEKVTNGYYAIRAIKKCL